LVFAGHLSVPERKALPDRMAKASLIRSVIKDGLRSGEWFTAWWMPDDSMIGCEIRFRGDDGTQIHWAYSGIEGDRSGVRKYDSHGQAAEALVREARPFWRNGIDGVSIDWDA
jgi:hypothetical protein